MIRFRAVIADPAWKFEDNLPGPGRGAAKHYKTQNSEDAIVGMLGVELARLEARVADDAFLFEWRVASQVELAYRVARGWGAVPKAELVWVKKTKHGKRHFGMGRAAVRAEHETCIIATWGSPVRASRSVRSVFEAPVPVDEDGRIIHSAKPDKFYEIVEEICGRGPYLEMNARRQRPGWTCVGLDVPRVIAPRRTR